MAPPGAGKTTGVPLALLDAVNSPLGCGDGKIVVLEPRRLAARAAAERMSSLVGDRLGETIGLKVRMQSLSGPKTRIEVVTEGVFARMILDDPSLEGVAAVLFDEFHERSLDADLGLALALDAQAALRPDLRLLVMSATLDGARVSRLMRDAPIVESQGRAFPVETVYLGRDPRERIEDAALRAVRRALAEQPGSLLVFLPGQAEILRLASKLEESLNDPAVDVCPLYGAMERAAQDRAIRPAPHGRRKIVLATSIAETSITIDGVRVVIDCGLVRAPRFEPDLGLTRLETLRVSRAAADQRRGRAGRTQPGRLLPAVGGGRDRRPAGFRAAGNPRRRSVRPAARPRGLGRARPQRACLGSIRRPPPPAPRDAPCFRSLARWTREGAITARGKAMRRLPLPPRLARMALQAEFFGEGEKACELAVVLTRTWPRRRFVRSGRTAGPLRERQFPAKQGRTPACPRMETLLARRRARARGKARGKRRFRRAPWSLWPIPTALRGRAEKRANS